MVDPASLIGAGAWKPGAWTPARCALWRQMDEAGQKRLEAWVSAERERGRCHRGQLPDQSERTAA